VTALEDRLRHVARETDALIARLLPPEQGPEARLLGAMRYATLGPGKRLRPLLVTESADLFGVPMARSLRVGAAIEVLHAYSLVHDDLPCMDDDDLRRGRPTVHRAYDEARAVLAGDGLQSMAFEILADPATHPSAEVRIDLVRALAHAAGPAGMVGGQAIDLAAATLDLDAAAVTRLQNLKTGAVFAFCCEAGGILGHASPQQRVALRAYAHDFGLAYQIADDLLDIEGDAAVVGKAVGKDENAGKATLVGLLGVEGARRQAALLANQAARHLDAFGDKAGLLRELAAFAIARRA
jgi:farnesyl diphosphate synthase